MKSKLSQSLFLGALLLTPAVTFAQFLPLVGIPGISDNNIDFNTYINTLYALSISIAGLLAVIKIIIAGVKYMLSDVVTSKAEAKSDIQGALIGLLIVVSAVVILNQINPRLTESNIFIGSVTRPAPQPVTNPGSPNTNQPLPNPSAPPPNTPVERRDIECSRQPDGSYDCAGATATCTGGGGRVLPESSYVSDPSDITCSYGTVRGINCEVNYNSVTEQNEPDCTAAASSCPSGSTYTQLSPYRAQCFTPY